MITKATVLVLGAGASTNYGFPSGLQLKAEICDGIRRQDDIFHDLVLASDAAHVWDFYNNLLLSSEMSVDAFLEHNPKYYEIGRRAIAHALIRKEKYAELFDRWIDKWLDPKNQDKHWDQLLFSKLNAPFEDFEKNDLKIITFNYGRSLEHFLWHSMRAKYSEEDEKTTLEKLRSIPILHIYGKLGSLPPYDSDRFGVPYDLFESVQGDEENWWRKYIFKASQKIFTVHQAEEMEDVVTKAQGFMHSADRIYFLGFGYDTINMTCLFVEDGKNLLTAEGLGNKCRGTALRISPHHKKYLGEFGLQHFKDDYANEARGRSHRPLNFPDSTIHDFLYYSPLSNLD